MRQSSTERRCDAASARRVASPRRDNSSPPPAPLPLSHARGDGALPSLRPREPTQSPRPCPHTPRPCPNGTECIPFPYRHTPSHTVTHHRSIPRPCPNGTEWSSRAAPRRRSGRRAPRNPSPSRGPGTTYRHARAAATWPPQRAIGWPRVQREGTWGGERSVREHARRWWIRAAAGTGGGTALGARWWCDGRARDGGDGRPPGATAVELHDDFFKQSAPRGARY